MPHQSLIRYSAALALAALIAPLSANAQLGRLKKAASDAAKEAAGVKQPEAKSSNASDNFVITADRLSAVMAAMGPVMQEAESEAASRALSAEYNKKHKAFETCVDAQTKQLGSGSMPSTEGMQRSAAISQKSIELLQRSQAAQNAKRYREVVALTDSMTATGSLSSLAVFNLDSKCGAYPYMPPAIIDREAARMARSAGGGEVGEDGRSKTSIPSANRAGMSTYQFGMVRERAALWALQQTNNAPVGNNKYSVFTTDEMNVLEAQAALLKKWAPLFKDRPALWATWADLAAW